jgi:D-alanyl-D-alanine carboxypeptidase (penicillin-binding protein 5/6)
MSAPFSFAEPPRRSRFRRTLLRLLMVAVLLGAVAAGGVVLYQASGHTAQAGPASTETLGAVVPPVTEPFASLGGQGHPKAARQEKAALPPLDESRAAAARVKGVHVLGGIVVDAKTGRVVWARRPHLELPIASLTKLMTAVAFAPSPKELSHMITIRKAWLGIGQSSIYLKPNQHITVGQLLQGLLMVSGNDAANTLAHMRSGTVPAFVRRMNARARVLGLRDSAFSNPSGLYDTANHSSAWDLADLGRYVLRDPVLSHIVSRRTAPAPRHQTWVNHNKLLWRYAGARGLKTGYTDLAGSCLAAAATRKGHTLIAIVLHADGDEFTMAERLLDYGFARDR